MGQTKFSGPVVSTNGFTAGASGTQIKQIASGTVSVTVAALAAGAEADVDVTITGVAAGDAIQIVPTEAASETGLMISQPWVASANTVTIRMTNASGSSLTGSTANWTYLWFDLT